MSFVRPELFQSVTVALSRATTVDEVARVVLDLGTTLVGAPRGGLWQMSGDGSALELVRSRGYSDVLAGAVTEVPEDSPLWVAMRASDEVSFFCASLLVEGRAVGAVCFNFDEPRELGEEERPYVQALVEQTGLALHRAVLLAKERDTRALAERAEDALRFLAEAGGILASSLDHDETLAAVTRLAVPKMADWAAVDVIDGGTGALRRVTVAHVDPRKIDLLRRLHELRPPSMDDVAGVAGVIRTGAPELTPRITDEMLAGEFSGRPDVLAIVRELGLTSRMIVALPMRGESWGAITLASGDPERRFSVSDVAFAEELARRAAGAIESTLAYRERVKVAETERDAFRESTAWFARARNRLERLYCLTTALASTMDTRGVADVTCEGAAHTVGSDTTLFYVVDEAERALVLTGRHGEQAGSGGGAGEERISLDAPVPVAKIVQDLRSRFFECRDELAAEVPAVAAALEAGPLCAWAILPMTGAAGNVLGVVSFAFRQPTSFSDEDRQLMSAVAEQCAVALDRARACEAEACALRKKDEFLAMLGHELRNPLAPIVTATNLIRLRGSATERELAILDRQAHHLVRLVDDLLDVSRITSGKLTLRQTPLEIGGVVAQALESTSKPFEDKRLRLHVDVPRVGLTVCGDHERLVQVVANLLANAAKFTAADKGVSVSASREDGMIAIRVCDEGEGIEPDLLPRVFDLFTQGRQTRDRSGGGLGLGLAIARSIVLAHKGAIVAESRGPGAGTTMTVTLPFFAQRADDAPVSAVTTAVKSASQRRRLLIVDDNADGAEMLADFFGTLGYETHVANDAPEALRVMDEILPDAAILDIGLPGMDGYELAAEVQTRFGARTPVLVALTGYAQASDRQQALACGFRAHFGKPIDMARLAATFDEILATA